MDEAKAAAYYDELTRKGGGAAKFKQGLGFSSASASASPSPHPSSLSSSFVRASSPTAAAKQARLDSVHNKLTAPDRRRDRDRERDRDRRGERHRDEEERRHRRSRRSRSRSRSRSRDRDRGHGREKSGTERRGVRKKVADVDYERLINGYSEMSPAERVKAKMKFQLSQTAANDTAMGMSAGWERFDFNKDAPLDGDEEIEVAEDDASVVKVIGKSFRSSAAEAKREEDRKAAHDQAMFGAPTGSRVILDIEPNQETDAPDLGEENPKEVLISDKVFAVQQGSWRDRVRRFQKSSEN